MDHKELQPDLFDICMRSVYNGMANKKDEIYEKIFYERKRDGRSSR